jgi:murein tripeptide amidase MpaA
VRSHNLRRLFFLISLVTAYAVQAAQETRFDPAILPPELPWDGASRSLMAAADDPWITPAERTGLTTTPSYDETMAWVERLVAAAPELQWTTLGVSPEGREIRLVIASAEGAATPAALAANGKPTLFAQAGIHSGEIDGKDAGLMLLRDLTVGGGQRALLSRANFLFVPIFNVDGHERSSPYGRINQRGPAEMGWRTNARNLNLNRDYTKLDTPEMRAMVAALDRWQPDLYLDLHVTDGADYQYDVTYGYTGTSGWSPSAAGWLDRVLRPKVDAELTAMGHVPGPLIFLMDERDPTQGNVDWTATPRYSNGYGDARHLPTILLENHSLKRYDRRVLGTYVFLRSILDTLGREGAGLRAATAEDRARRRDPLPLAFAPPQEPPPTMTFLGVASTLTPSAISGGLKVEWTGEPITLTIPNIVTSVPVVTARRPAAYWIPPTYPRVIELLTLHGIAVERLPRPREVTVRRRWFEQAKADGEPFEGHTRVTPGEAVEQIRTETFPAGSARVATDQPLGDLAMLLLEPAHEDSFFQWGFFLEVLQRTEYVEGYVMEPTAERMLAEDPQLGAEFRQKLLTDAEFAADPRARLQWFYRRTPYWDDRFGLYPVALELADD